jgi:hypothetical protein
MKTKLLKIVRERYSITKIDKLEMNPNDAMLSYKKKFGLPFYILTDHKVKKYIQPVDYKYETLLNILSDWIRTDYLHKMKKKKSRERVVTKVWFDK